MRRAYALVAALLLGGCGGTTGSQLIHFAAEAHGTSAAADFTSGLGFHVTLQSASLQLAAVYLNLSKPSSGGGETACVLPGIYGGQVFGPLMLADLRDPTPVPFAGGGDGTAGDMHEAELWLTGGDINAAVDPTVIFSASGSADKDGTTWPFTASVTISENRARPPYNAAEPDSRPICQRRIVSPIPFLAEPAQTMTISDGGTLDLAIDIARAFDGVDFTQLPADGVIPDSDGGIGGALFSGLTSYAPYSFTFSPASR